MPKSFWENVLWTDYSFMVKHTISVSRKQNEAFKENNTFLTVKHGGGSVLLW
jgi:hypothetical protein